MTALSDIVAGMGDPALAVTPEGRILLANQAFGTLLGVGSRRLAQLVESGMHVNMLVHPSMTPTALVQALASGRPCQLAELPCRVGAELNVVLWVTIVPLENGHEILVVMRDASSESRTQERYRELLRDAHARADELERAVDARTRELQDANAHLSRLAQDAEAKSSALNVALLELKDSHELFVRNEKLAAVGRLASSLAEELRDPLTAVRGATAYVRKRFAEGGDLSDDRRVAQMFALVDRQLNACAKILTDMAEFSRERRIVLSPCALHALADEVIAALPTHGAVVENLVPKDLAVPSLDKEQFRHALGNLVQNAIEAMPGDGGHVRVSAEATGDQLWRITVADNGPGIAADLVPHIFEPLFTTKSKGSGVGLAIVEAIVHRHGGTITVESELGRGTRFIVELRRDATQHEDGHGARSRSDSSHGMSRPEGASQSNAS